MANPGPASSVTSNQYGFPANQGFQVGTNTTDTVGFYGATPITRPTSPAQAAINPAAGMGVLTQYASTQSPAIVAANTSGERAMTVTGVLATDMVFVANKPTAQAGLLVGSARVSAANTVQLTFGNATGAGITPTASEAYQILTLPSSAQLTATLSPAAVAANTTAEQQFTVTGLLSGAMVAVNKPTVQAGLIITNSRIVSDNTVGITFCNLTGASITPTASEVYTFGQILTGAQAVEQCINLGVNVGTLAATAANTTAEQTITVNGLAATDIVVGVSKPTAQAGLGIVGWRVSAANTLAITFSNNTAGALTATASEVYQVVIYRPNPGVVATQSSAALTPISVAANTTAEQTFTVSNLTASTAVLVNKPSNSQAGLSIAGVRISGANTLAITFVNATGSAIVPNAETYQILAFGAANPTAGNFISQAYSNAFSLETQLLNSLRNAATNLGLIKGS